jgi:hypothetical protein
MSHIFNNVQKDTEVVFMMYNNFHAITLAPFYESHDDNVPLEVTPEDRSTLPFTIEKRTDDQWDTETPIEDYIAAFHMRELMDSNDGSFRHFHFTIVRAANQIARVTRRGFGNNIYYREGKFEPTNLNEALQRMFKFHTCPYVPEGHLLVTYEGNAAFDVGFIYNPTRGILRNKDHEGYGRLVKIVNPE